MLPWLLLATALALLPPTASHLAALFERLLGGLPAQTTPPGVAGLGPPSLAELVPGAGPRATPGAEVVTIPDAPAEPDDPRSVEALDALAAELQRHQAALAAREQSIELREAVVQAVETRVHEQVAKLERLNGDLQRLLGEVSTDQRERIAQLIKVYEAMKAKNAAAIFDPMALDLLLPIVRGMRETKVAAIVAEMDPAKARALTAELARERPLPKPP